MDIRNYFRPSGSVTNSKKEASCIEKKRKKANIDSDDEDLFSPRNKKNQRPIESDSDDDLFSKKTLSKKKSRSLKAESEAKSKRPLERFKTIKSPPKLKPTTSSDFFGNETVKIPLKSKTFNQKQVKDELHDNEFERTLSQINQIQTSKKKEKTDVVDKSLKHPKNSSDLASKLAAKVKKMENLEEPVNKKIKLENYKNSNPGRSSPLKQQNGKEKDKATPSKKPKRENISHNVTSFSDSKSASEACINEEKTPMKGKSKIAPTEENLSLHAKNGSNTKENLNNSMNEESLIMTPEEKKKHSAAAYKKYLQRSGPKNPGSKPIPEGKPGCFTGLTFVLTGVLESLDREEVTEIVKKYNGKVTSSVSKNTTYLVVGEEPGESKMKKAEKIGTISLLNEDEFLKLISEKAGDTKSPPKNSSKPSKKIKQTPPKTFKETTSTPLHKKLSSNLSDLSSTCSTLSQTSINSDNSKGPTLTFSKPSATESLLWVDKYRPSQLKSVIGQHGDASNAKKLLNWLSNWFSNQSGSKKLVKPSPWAKNNDGSYYKAALLSGPPGVGKTTTAYLSCKQLNFDTVEMNASVTRSKRTLQEEIAELLSNQSLKGFSSVGSSNSLSRNHVLLMDEVDGMSGNEDRGGMQELINLIKKSKVPIICMCNDRNHPKIRSLSNYCYDLRFQKPRIEQIRGGMMSVCFKEGIKIKPEALDQMILSAKHDIRQVLHHLSVWSADQKNLDADSVKKEANAAKKDFKLGPWDVCQKVFNESDHKNMSIHDKVGLFFHDYSIGPLFVQENYLKVAPHSARGNPKKLLEQIAKTANVLADGDLVEKNIRKQNAWSLLPVQALFSSVFPGELMSGHFNAQIEFPKWLGNNSRRNKFDRLAQELHMHMRLKISGSKSAVITDYSSPLREKILQPLIRDGTNGVEESVSSMTSHDLIREDLESIIELSKWPHTKDMMALIESKVKAAFTRSLNKDSHLNPYSVASISKGKRNAATMGEDMEDEEGTYESEDDDDDDISKDSMITKGKKGDSSSKATSSNSKAKGVKRKKC